MPAAWWATRLADPFLIRTLAVLLRKSVAVETQGGLIGYNAVTLTRSYSSGLVTGENNGISYTGALIGGNSGDLHLLLL